MIIGIIGKVGSGKTVCTEFLRKNYRAIVFSCDDIAKELIENHQVEYEKTSSYEFFINEDLQKKCRQIVHPAVYEKIENSIKIINAKSNNKSVLYVIETALPSDRLYNICDKVIYINNSLESKIILLGKNRHYSDKQTKLIYNSQKYYEKYYMKADFKILNDGTVSDLIEKLKEVINEIYIIRK